MRRQLTSTYKTPLYRTVLWVLPSASRSTPKSKKLKGDIMLSKHQIDDMLKDSVERLSLVTDLVLPSLNLQAVPIWGANPEVSVSVQDPSVGNPSECRVCVYIFSPRDTATTRKREELGISHLVAAQIGKKDTGWAHLGGLTSAKVETTIQKLPFLIHDVALDIVMFHSRQELVERYGGSVRSRIEFSRRKSDFARANSLTSYYGPLDDPAIEYYSFAAHCRTASWFDYEKYSRLWESFVLHEIVATEDFPVLTTRTPDPVAAIFKHHKHAGQLSKSKISKEIHGLQPGVYLLMTTHKKPGTKRLRSHIAMLFNRGRFHRGLWRIVCFQDYKMYADQYPYILFYKFKVSR